MSVHLVGIARGSYFRGFPSLTLGKFRHYFRDSMVRKFRDDGRKLENIDIEV